MVSPHRSGQELSRGLTDEADGNLRVGRDVSPPTPLITVGDAGPAERDKTVCPGRVRRDPHSVNAQALPIELDHITPPQLAAPSRFHLAVDDHLAIDDHQFGLSPRIDGVGDLQELRKPDHVALNIHISCRHTLTVPVGKEKPSAVAARVRG